MQFFNGLPDRVINMDDKAFEAVALQIFRFQSQNNQVYRSYIEHLDLNPPEINGIQMIPYLPIELFKSRKIVTGTWEPEMVFTSSGTGKSATSKHYMRNLSYYHEICSKIFEEFYGPPDRYHILALLPSYLERTGSSLVNMLNHLIEESKSKHSGFYLKDYRRLMDQLRILRRKKDRKLMLWGVSFALLDLAEMMELDLSGSIIIETGGMKGKREEIVREELHERLKASFGGVEIHSEYGMAELSSQAYMARGGRFTTAPWMKVLVRDISDPFNYLPPGRVGGINVIDLANVHSCAFIETQDLGSVDDHGMFTVLGRLDNADIRGCNLLY